MSQLKFRARTFICPICHIHSQQQWTSAIENKMGQMIQFPDLYWSTCSNCEGRSIWFKERIVAPVSSSAPLANSDMPDNIQVDFNEARDVAERSPRSAAGLLRLCLQKLCIELGCSGKNLNADIGQLVSKGLPVEIQEALDAVRIVGNSQLHPNNDGIDLTSNSDAVHILFMLVNLIVQNLISVPRMTREYYASLPEQSRNAVIERTDKYVVAPRQEAT